MTAKEAKDKSQKNRLPELIATINRISSEGKTFFYTMLKITPEIESFLKSGVYDYECNGDFLIKIDWSNPKS